MIINKFELQIKNPINNLNRIEISGIFGSGNYDLTLITTDKQKTNLNYIFDKFNLFFELFFSVWYYLKVFS